MLDRFIIEFDKGLRTLLASPSSSRQYPGQHLPTDTLSEKQDKQRAAALMRVNHAGEVCTQALYSAQSITARNPNTLTLLHAAAHEGAEHLAWCDKRIKELGSHTSLLNPLFYSAYWGLGFLAGSLGEKWNLGLLVETQQQAGKHLARHLDTLPAEDQKSRAIVRQIQIDEANHANQAITHGATALPFPLNTGMRILSNIMTKTTYHL